MERFENMTQGVEPTVGKLRPSQIATMRTWNRVPDKDTKMASLVTIHVVPENRSTMTYMNPLDPGDQSNPDWYDHGIPTDKVVPARAGY